MSTNVFLVPCDAPNFDRTVGSTVDVAEYPDAPSALEGEGTVRFWGARDGTRNREYFEKMEPGDLVLFYQDGEYVATGWIGTTFEDEDGWASSTFWEDAPSTMLYTIEGYRSVRVPRSAVNRIFDYVEDYSPEGLMRVADNRVDNSPEAIEEALRRYTERSD